MGTRMMDRNAAVRFPAIPLEEMTAEQKDIANTLIVGPRGGVRGPFNALLRNPSLADRVRQLGDSIRFENSLPPVLRELAILIAARFWSAKYEWHAHSKLAIEYGLQKEKLEAIGQGLMPTGLSSDEMLIYQFCSEILYEKDISEMTYSAVIQRFGEITALDILATVGYFGFVSLILNAIRYPVPEGGINLPDF